jgi:nucleotide-binding universal stress UspA family protein
MLSLPPELGPVLKENYDNVLRVLAREFGTLAFGIKFGSIFGLVVGVIVGLLLLSAVNTAVAAMIGLFYMMARDGEMPRAFTRLNGFGVPWFPLGLAVAVPFLVAFFAEDLNSLAGLYAIGVVGAIAVNLGSCSINKRLPLRWHHRAVMLLTFLVLAAVELTIAKTRQNALFFAVIVLMFGLALRTWSQRKAGLRTLTVSEELAAAVAPEVFPDYQLKLDTERTILVAARGMTPVLRFALEEAHLRKATLYILYVKELAVALPGPVAHETPRWQSDKQASAIMYPMLHLGKQHEVSVIPLYAVSDNPAGTILDLAATFGVDLVMLGASHRKTLVGLLKGNVVTEVAQGLPESIQLVIYG